MSATKSKEKASFKIGDDVTYHANGADGSIRPKNTPVPAKVVDVKEHTFFPGTEKELKLNVADLVVFVSTEPGTAVKRAVLHADDVEALGLKEKNIEKTGCVYFK